MSTPIRALALRSTAARCGGRALFTFSLAALFALAGALPADGQASRTRPSDGTSSGTASGGSGQPAPSQPATASPAPSAPSASAAPSNVGRTRPGAPADGRTVVERDERRPHRPNPHVVIVNPWAWWGSYFWYGYGGYYGPYGGYYGPYGGAYGPYGPAWSGRRVNDRMGALDLDLKPGDTQVWLDGQLIGIADRFDGWPGYLWLEEGDYHFVFYREGYRTIAREYRIRPGLVIQVTDRLERGESVPPEELIPPQPTPRRDARVRRNEELRRRAAEAPVVRRDTADAAADDALLAGEEGSDWHDRAPEGTLAGDDSGVGSLRLTVVPADASVYLDGRFLGTGADVGRLRRGLAVTAGEHLLEVVRPGHAPVARRVVIDDGDDLELEIALEPR